MQDATCGLRPYMSDCGLTATEEETWGSVKLHFGRVKHIYR